MADLRSPAPVPAGQTVIRSCWLCGIRLPADRMVADGGSGCADVRWYCLDTWGCTERWTARPAGRALGRGAVEKPAPQGKR